MMWAALLSAFTIVFGAAPFRVLRQLLGSGPFWLLGLGLTILSISGDMFFLSLILFMQTVLVGTFAEFEERNFTLRQSSGFSILLTTLVFCLGVYGWSIFTGKNGLLQLDHFVTLILERAKAMNFEFLKDIQVRDVIVQLPSAVLIFIILSLGSALVFERRLSQWAGVKMVRREKLSDFSAPDFVVWCFIFSLLGAFGQFGYKPVELVAVNVLNVSIVIYFFQGLAVLGKYFEVFHLSPFWRFLWIIILVVQLPILMSLLGLVDYWANFRKAFSKKAAELKKKRVQD